MKYAGKRVYNVVVESKYRAGSTVHTTSYWVVAGNTSSALTKAKSLARKFHKGELCVQFTHIEQIGTIDA